MYTMQAVIYDLLLKQYNSILTPVNERLQLTPNSINNNAYEYAKTI